MEILNRLINVNITSKTIFKTVVILILIYFLYLIRDILAIFFVALVFSSALDPSVDWLAKRKIPRTIGILSIYLILFAIASLIVYLIIPPLINEITQLSLNLPSYLDKINYWLNNFSANNQSPINLLDNFKSGLSSFGSSIEAAAKSVFTAITAIFGGVVSFVLILVLIFYMVVEENAMKKLVWSIAPAKHQPYIMNLIDRMQMKLGLWLRGQLILIVALFVLAYIGFFILGLNYALILALFVALVQVLPFFGPIIGAIPVLILSYIQSPLLCLFVTIFYLIVQTIENNILVPKVMQKTIGLNPIVVIFVLLSGYQIAGVIGAIISLPVATAVSVFIKDTARTVSSKQAAVSSQQKKY